MALCILPISASLGLQVLYAQEFIITRPRGLRFDESFRVGAAQHQTEAYGAEVHATVLVRCSVDAAGPLSLLIYHLGDVALVSDDSHPMASPTDPLGQAACRCWAPDVLDEAVPVGEPPALRLLRASKIIGAQEPVEILAMRECAEGETGREPCFTLSWDDLHLADNLLRCLSRSPIFVRFRVENLQGAGLKLLRLRFNTNAEVLPPALDGRLSFPVQGPEPMIELMGSRVQRWTDVRTPERAAFARQLEWITVQRQPIPRFDILMTGPEFARTEVEVDGRGAYLEQTLVPAETLVPGLADHCLVYGARFESDDFSLRLTGRDPQPEGTSRAEYSEQVEFAASGEEQKRLIDPGNGQTVATLVLFGNGTALISWPAYADAARFLAVVYRHLPRYLRALGHELRATARLRGPGWNHFASLTWVENDPKRPLGWEPPELKSLLEPISAPGTEVRLARFQCELGIVGWTCPPPSLQEGPTVGILFSHTPDQSEEQLTALILDLFERTREGQPVNWDAVREWLGRAAQHARAAQHVRPAQHARPALATEPNEAVATEVAPVGPEVGATA